MLVEHVCTKVVGTSCSVVPTLPTYTEHLQMENTGGFRKGLTQAMRTCGTFMLYNNMLGISACSNHIHCACCYVNHKRCNKSWLFHSTAILLVHPCGIDHTSCGNIWRFLVCAGEESCVFLVPLQEQLTNYQYIQRSVNTLLPRSNKPVVNIIP